MGPLPYSLAIFDFDSTLADSWQVMGRAIIEGADVFGYRRLSAEEAERLRGQDNTAVMAAMDVRMWQLPRIAIHMRRVAAERAGEIALFPGVEAMLQALATGGMQIAVVSSNGEATIRRVLGPDLSALVADFACGAAIFGKAAKFRRVVRRAGVAPAQAVGVGDEVRDIEAARAAGIASVAVTWGYATRAILEGSSPTHVVTRVTELTDLLTSR
jgi:phosphoglycolate phosphatase